LQVFFQKSIALEKAAWDNYREYQAARRVILPAENEFEDAHTPGRRID